MLWFSQCAVFIAMRLIVTCGVEFPIAQRVFNDVYSLDFVEWCEHLTILEEFILERAEKHPLCVVYSFHNGTFNVVSLLIFRS